MWFVHSRISYDNALYYASKNNMIYMKSKDKTKNKKGKLVHKIIKNLDINFSKTKELKNKCVTNTNLPKWCKWLSKTPASIRAQSVISFADACHSTFKANEGKDKIFIMKSKKKRNPNNQIIGLEKTKIKFKTDFDHINNKERVYLNLFKNSGNVSLEVKDKKEILEWLLKYEQVPIKHRCDGELQFNRNTRSYYLVLPYVKEFEPPIKRTKNNPIFDTVAMDPGVRKFQTYYSPEGEFGILLPNLKKTLLKKYKKISHIQSIIDNENLTKNKKTKLRRKIRILFEKCRNIRMYHHYKGIQYLSNTFKNIILPPFETSKMISKLNRNITRKTAREMLSLGHYEFKTRLIDKCGERIKILPENLTSQTCTHCGMLTKMKGCEVYNCKNCNFTSDRDLNGAKNIFLKHHEPENFLMNQCKYKLMLQKK